MHSQLEDKSQVIHLARLVVRKSSGARGWMYPSLLSLRSITDDTCKHGHRLRVGLHMIHTNHDRSCVCGEEI